MGFFSPRVLFLYCSFVLKIASILTWNNPDCSQRQFSILSIMESFLDNSSPTEKTKTWKPAAVPHTTYYSCYTITVPISHTTLYSLLARV